MRDNVIGIGYDAPSAIKRRGEEIGINLCHLQRNGTRDPNAVVASQETRDNAEILEAVLSPVERCRNGQ